MDCLFFQVGIVLVRIGAHTLFEICVCIKPRYGSRYAVANHGSNTYYFCFCVNWYDTVYPFNSLFGLPAGLYLATIPVGNLELQKLNQTLCKYTENISEWG